MTQAHLNPHGVLPLPTANSTPISVTLDTAATSAIGGTNTGQPTQGTAEAIAIGVSGNAPAGYGVYGHSVSQYGVYGQSASQAGVRGDSVSGDAVVGVASSKLAAGISGQNTAAGGGLAGRFQGDVAVSGQLTVSGKLALENPVQVDSKSAHPAAFVYTVQAGDVYPNPSIYGTGPGYPLCVVLHHPSLDGQPNAMLFVTPLATQRPQRATGGQGTFEYGSDPGLVPSVMAQYGAFPLSDPPVAAPNGQSPVPLPITNNWVLFGASVGQSFQILVVYTQGL
jgi:hypothetical protein